MNKAIINIKYNHLNQPTEIDFGYFDKLCKQKTKYIYTATGVKLQTKIYEEGKLKSKTDYSGAYVYENDELSYTNIQGGRIINNQSSINNYQYYLTDHLGNVRVTFTKGANGKAEIIQEDHYYPFGMRMSGQHFSNTDLINKYLYNGKEQQEQTNYYDYGFRQFDAQLGRWHVIDAMSEKYFSTSPYAYVQNDPINHRDYLGLWKKRVKEDELELDMWLRGGGIMNYAHNLNNHISSNLNRARSSARNISLLGTINGIQGTTVNDLSVIKNIDGTLKYVFIGRNAFSAYVSEDPVIDEVDNEKNENYWTNNKNSPDWNKLNDTEKIMIILKALQTSFELGTKYINLRNLFKNYPVISGNDGGSTLYSENINLYGIEGTVFMSVIHDINPVVNNEIGSNYQIELDTPKPDGFEGRRVGFWQHYHFNYYRPWNVKAGIYAISIEVPNSFDNAFYKYLRR